ncbi:LysR family transcriptional regulator [Streptomyces purpureus]|uniref:HTH lysR-type domain-containing protein n=1 Tax=Streptomyces purpureus TaxID=1951 RepID=A0A918H1U1_9ACTN|nr:LysR family transcriptional regulator [Streptomyces purpureus]GGT29768.1 hypothetical protein GCM10014713_24160 [Streptomyces purpureus]
MILAGAGVELRQVRYFEAVVQEGNLTRAAEALGLRSSSLSEQIIALERTLGAPLFHRTPAGMEPTPAGLALVPYARALLETARAAARSVREASAGQVIRMGVTPGSPHTVVERLWRSFKDRERTLELLDVPTADQLCAVRHGALEAGLVVLPADTGGLRTAPVSEERLGVLVAHDHPLAAKSRLTWEDLDGEELLWFPRDLAPGYHDDVLSVCHAAGWWPRLRARPPRRNLFVTELRSEPRLVALRPRWALADGEGLAWRPLEGAPALVHALIWAEGTGAVVEEVAEGLRVA